MHASSRSDGASQTLGERDPLVGGLPPSSSATTCADAGAQTQSTALSRKAGAGRVWAGRAVSGIACIPFLFGITVSLFPSLTPVMTNELVHLGVPLHLRSILVVLMILCLTAYLMPRTVVFGSVLFTGYMGGAILAHLRVGDLPVFQVIVPTLIWIGAYLREPRVGWLLPIRR